MIEPAIDPDRVDVNVHPTKSIVYFLEQDNIISSVQDYVESLILSSSGNCNVYPKIPLMTDAVTLSSTGSSSSSSSKSATTTTGGKKMHMVSVPETLGGPPPASAAKPTPKVYAHQLIRTDAKERRLEEFMASQSQNASNTTEDFAGINRPDGVPWREFDFESLKNMKQALCTAASVSLRSLFKEHTYIGAVNANQVLIQHSTSIYLVSAQECLRNFFYQVLVLSFGNFGSYKLSESAPMTELLHIANDQLSDEEVEQKAATVLDNREMLDDYFCLGITENGCVESIPSLIDGFVPQLESLPQLIHTLSNDVIWDNVRMNIIDQYDKKLRYLIWKHCLFVTDNVTTYK
ncbi:unnamed protein product [Gongylonema pulchrum]|uniref:DNA_mis_repair domain-containing protein n=1 Tax=Gongylonema pulchrum TaxID=637853 RepID=A0A183D4M1_9BILA|nr:unnamed protein product [Gongylonema pulchrum]